MTESANSTPPSSNDLQVIALNVSYSLLYDSVPRSGSLKVIINSVPAELLKKTEMTRKKRFTNPSEKIPLSEDEKIVKKVVDMATLNTVTNLQRRFSQVLDELRSVSQDTFEKLKVLSYEEFCDNLKSTLEKDGVKEYNIIEEVEKQECGICLESYTLNKKVDLSGSRKRKLEDKEDPNITKKLKRNSNEPINDPNVSDEKDAVLYTHEPVLLTNCPHIFGRSCLYSWGNKNNSCPLCRTKISTKNAEYTMEELNEVLQNDETLTSMNFKELLDQSDRSSILSTPVNDRQRYANTGLNEGDATPLSNIRGNIQSLFPDFANRFSQVLERSITESLNDGENNNSNGTPEQQERGTVYIVSGNNHITTHPDQNNNNSAPNARTNYNLGRIIEIIRGNVRNQTSPAMAVLDMLSTLFNVAPEAETEGSSEPRFTASDQSSTATPEPSNENNDTNSNSQSTDPRSRLSQSDVDATAAIAEAVRMAMQYRHLTRDVNNSDEQPTNNSGEHNTDNSEEQNNNSSNNNEDNSSNE